MSETEIRVQACPNCGARVEMVPYDIGSGPEMSCTDCEWCWGADGQSLEPLDTERILREAREALGQRWAEGAQPA